MPINTLYQFRQPKLFTFVTPGFDAHGGAEEPEVNGTFDNSGDKASAPDAWTAPDGVEYSNSEWTYWMLIFVLGLWQQRFYQDYDKKSSVIANAGTGGELFTRY